MQPEEKNSCRKDDAKKHGGHRELELPLRDSFPKHQQANYPAHANDCRPYPEMNDRAGQSVQGVHVCPSGEKPESYRDALLAVISDPLFVGPVAFLAGLITAAVAIQSLSGSLAV